DPAEQSLGGRRVGQIFLTPRLVAKLLTESYKTLFFGEAQLQLQKGYTWLQSNPADLVTDPDFLQFNPEFRVLSASQPIEAAGLVVEQPTADAAAEVWRWILADPEARNWLHGKPDPWGMTVNPNYSTDAATNPSGVAFAATPTNVY